MPAPRPRHARATPSQNVPIARATPAPLSCSPWAYPTLPGPQRGPRRRGRRHRPRGGRRLGRTEGAKREEERYRTRGRAQSCCSHRSQWTKPLQSDCTCTVSPHAGQSSASCCDGAGRRRSRTSARRRSGAGAAPGVIRRLRPPSTFGVSLH
eukprot:gene2713-biopygen6545